MLHQHVDLDPCATALGEGLGGVGRGRAFLEDVLRVGDALARGADEVELGREDLVAVQQHVDAVPADDRAARVPDQGGPERRLRDPEVGDLQMGLDVPASARQEEGGQQWEYHPSPDWAPPPHPTHSRRSSSIRSPVAGWVLRKPPPLSPDVFISQVSVLIITSLLRPTRWSSSTP